MMLWSDFEVNFDCKILSEVKCNRVKFKQRCATRHAFHIYSANMTMTMNFLASHQKKEEENKNDEADNADGDKDGGGGGGGGVDRVSKSRNDNDSIFAFGWCVFNVWYS